MRFCLHTGSGDWRERVHDSRVVVSGGGCLGVAVLLGRSSLVVGAAAATLVMRARPVLRGSWMGWWWRLRWVLQSLEARLSKVGFALSVPPSLVAARWGRGRLLYVLNEA